MTQFYWFFLFFLFSHRQLQLQIRQQEENPPYRVFFSKLHLIDLAGSEDNRKTENTGLRYIHNHI
jgi:hypothetical protein